MKRICSICARGGSKGVENKNIRNVGGKPLIAHTILQARDSGQFEVIAVSSDSAEILDISMKWGADYVVDRPQNLASDTSAKLPAIQHCIKSIEALTGNAFDIIVDLDATSPLRDREDIIQSLSILENSDSPNLISGAPARRSPYFNLVELNDHGYVRRSKDLNTPIVRRQDTPACYDMNASIYIWKRDGFFDYQKILLERTIFYEMPEERSLDIDSELDFEIVKYLIERSKK